MISMRCFVWLFAFELFSASISNAYITLQDASAKTVTAHDNDGILVGGFAKAEGNRFPALIALNQHGKINPQFGTDGMLAIPMGHGTFNAMQSDSHGHVFAVGNSATVSSKGLIVKADILGNCIPNYGSNGTLNITFGDGNAINDLVVLDNDAIIAAGTSVHDGLPYAFLVKITPDGAVDTSWADQGFLIPIFEKSWCQSIHKLPDGSVIISGRIGSTSLFSAKVTLTGALDITYGTMGLSIIPTEDGIRGGASATDNLGQLCIVGSKGQQICIAHLDTAGSPLSLFWPTTVNPGVTPGTITIVGNSLYISGVDSKTTFLLELDMLSGAIMRFVDLKAYLSDKALVVLDELHQPESLSLSARSINFVHGALYLSGKASNRAFVLKTDLDLVPDTSFGVQGFAFYPAVNVLTFADKGTYRQLPCLCWNASACNALTGPDKLPPGCTLAPGQMLLNTTAPADLESIIVSTHTEDGLHALCKLKQIRPADIIRITDTSTTGPFIDCLTKRVTFGNNFIGISVQTNDSTGSFSVTPHLCIEGFGPAPLTTNYLFSNKKSEQVFATIAFVNWTDIPFEADNDILSGWTHKQKSAQFECPADGIYYISYSARLSKPDDSSKDYPTWGTPIVAFRVTANKRELVGSRSAIEIHDLIASKKAGKKAWTNEVISPHSHTNSFLARLKQGDSLAFQLRKEAEIVNAGNPGVKLTTAAGSTFGKSETDAPSMAITIFQIDQEV